MVRTGMAVVALLGLVAFVPAHAHAVTGGRAAAAGTGDRLTGSNVRGGTARMTEVIRTAIKRSATFASLVEALDESDVIVHVEELRTLPKGIEGRLTFVGAAGGARYLRVQLLADLAPLDMISVLGHELQHALEVAEHPEVRDSASLARLYNRIGETMGRRDRYDTPAARETGRRVRNELL